MNLKTLFSIIIFILKIFIIIGDFVLFLLKTLLLKIKQTASGINTFYSFLSISLKIKYLKIKIKASDFKFNTSQELTVQRLKRNRIKFKIRKNYLSIKRSFRKFFTRPFKGKPKPTIAFQEAKNKVSFFPKLKYFSFGLVFSAIFIFFPVLFFIFLQQLPNPQELTIREMPQTTKILDRNGALLYQVYANENRTLIPLSDVPQNLKNAHKIKYQTTLQVHTPAMPSKWRGAASRQLIGSLGGISPIRNGS